MVETSVSWPERVAHKTCLSGWLIAWGSRPHCGMLTISQASGRRLTARHMTRIWAGHLHFRRLNWTFVSALFQAGQPGRESCLQSCLQSCLHASHVGFYSHWDKLRIAKAQRSIKTAQLWHKVLDICINTSGQITQIIYSSPPKLRIFIWQVNSEGSSSVQSDIYTLSQP